MQNKTIHCKLIEDDYVGDAITSAPFQFKSSIEFIPLEMYRPATNYILTSWNSNHFIKSTYNGCYEIIEKYGDDIILDKDYLLIRPKY